MSRLAYQRLYALGKVLNIGCGDDPAGLGDNAVHVDIDRWRLPNFVQADCHCLPFENKVFDTAILGDVLEHVLSPERAVQEAARVARMIVITVPEELALPSVGQHIAQGLSDRAAYYRKVHGYTETNDEAVIITHKKTDYRFLSAYPENVMPHDAHINRFDEAWIDRLISLSGMAVVDKAKVPENTWYNWLIHLEE